MPAAGAPPPTLRTQRLELRPAAAGDLDDLVALFATEEVSRYLTDGVVVGRDFLEQVLRDSQADFEKIGLGLWCARRPGEPALVGLTGFRHFHEPPQLELLYALMPGCQGQGLATEMAAAAVEHAFGPGGLTRVLACTDAPNEASVAVMKRLGMSYERSAPGEIWEQIYYAITADAWAART